MKKIIRSHGLFNLIFCLLILAWLGAVISQAYRTLEDHVFFSCDDYFQCNEGWYDSDGNAVNLSEVHFSLYELGKEHIYRYDLPQYLEISEGLSLCFLSRGIDYRIAVNENGEQHDNPDEMWHIIHEFHQNGAGLTGSDIGLTLQTIPLDRKHLSTIYISLIPREISAFVMDIRLQKSAFFVLSNIRSRIGMFVESIFIVFFGIIGIVYTFFAVEANREYRRMYYAWGVFSFFLGVILLIQTQIFQMLTGKPEIYNAIKYSLGLIIVYPHALQIDYSARHPHRHYCYIIGVVVAVLLVFEAYSCFFLNVSMYRLFFVCALPLMLINVLMIVIYLARDILYIKKNLEAVFSSVVLSIILLLSLITFADLTPVWHLKGTYC